jgi:hypothetical protein
MVFFAYPRIHELPAVAGVARIEVSGETARITLGPDFAEKQAQAIAAVVQALRERGVRSAILVQQNGSAAGHLSVTDGKVYGMPPAVKRNDVPLPVVPTQTPPPQVQPGARGGAQAQPQTAAGQPPQGR